MTSSLLVLVGADVIRPSLAWLLTGGKKRKLARNMICSRDPGGFARLRQLCQDDPAITPAAQAKVVFRSAVIIAAKGGVLADVTIGDVLEVLDAERAVRARRDSGAATFRVLREMGIFGPGVPTLREILDTGQRTVEELVDRYPIACRPVRDLIVDYLKERQPAIDYVTLQHRASQLARSFWADLEQHHPGIDTLRLPRDVASAWKQRLRTRSTTATSSTGEKTTVTIERLSYLDTLASVRAFYLDLAEWALDDPARWGPWVAPCPIRPEDLERRKFTRRRKARMDARTRDRLPVLPVLARTAARWRDDAQALLAAARLAEPGQEFTAAGQTLLRAARPHGDPRNVWARDPATGRQRLLNREEDHAFWAWAIIEVLRSTGIRAEELLELSHHSLVQYRLPDTGELVPLLQIAPSKTDAERLLVVSPELADVLSAIICRVRGSDGAVPLVRGRDRHELIWLPPSPLLFQRRTRTENHVITGNFVADRLDDALARTGLTDPAAGGPLRFTPHDFRRLFITDAILQRPAAAHRPGHRRPPGHQRHHGLQGRLPRGGHQVPPGVPGPAAGAAAHRGIPGAHRRGMAGVPRPLPAAQGLHRNLRPGVRHPLHPRARLHPLPDALARPRPAHRLAEIRDNLTARIAEAQQKGWLGEVEGLQVSLAGAKEKLAQIDRRQASRPASRPRHPRIPAALTATTPVSQLSGYTS